MIGIGAQLLGSTPAGSGQAESIPMLPSTSKGARFIGTDGNPVIDPVNGGFMKADPVAMRVYFAIRTTLKSAGANQALGTDWPKKIDSRFVSYLTNAISTALLSMIQAKEIRLDSVAVTYPQPERYTVAVAYFNLTTQRSEQVVV